MEIHLKFALKVSLFLFSKDHGPLDCVHLLDKQLLRKPLFQTLPSPPPWCRSRQPELPEG